MIGRRLFLGGLLASLSLSAWAVGEVIMLEVNCPERAFDQVRRDLAKMQAASPDAPDDAEFLRRGRAWLGGPQVDRSGPEWRAAEGVPIRVVKPDGQARGVVLQMHGGGWVMGNAASDRKMAEELANRAGVAVVSVDYRLAPEHPYPAGIDDCVTAADWLLRNAQSQFGTTKVAIMGCSAGSHLAAMTLLRLGPRATQFSAAVLYYGVYDLGVTPGARLAPDDDHPDLSTTSIRRMIQWFTPGLQPEQRRVAAISPLYAPVPKLPETLFLVGGADILVDDTLYLAQRWSEKNVVRVALFPGAPHGFNMYSLDGVDDSVTMVCDYLAEKMAWKQ